MIPAKDMYIETSENASIYICAMLICKHNIIIFTLRVRNMSSLCSKGRTTHNLLGEHEYFGCIRDAYITDS